MGDALVRRFYPRTLTAAESSAEIDLAHEKALANGFHFQAAELKADGSLAGLLGIGVIPEKTRAAIPGHPLVEIGWVLRRDLWGRGLAPEGARAWLDYAWLELELPEVVAFTAEVNEPSQRVMQKIGMTRDPGADFKHPNVPEGHLLRRHVLYRITRS